MFKSLQWRIKIALFSCTGREMESPIPIHRTPQFNLNKDQNVTAVFSKNIYNVSITVIGKGSVSQNGVFQEENIYSHGDQLALVAFPNEGQDFKYWAYTNSPDHNLSTNLEENYTMVGNLDLIAVFEPRQYTLAFEPITSNTEKLKFLIAMARKPIGSFMEKPTISMQHPPITTFLKNGLGQRAPHLHPCRRIRK